MISAGLQSMIRDADWDAEIARQMGDTGGMLDAIARAETLRTGKERLVDPEWLREGTLNTEHSTLNHQ